MGMPIRKQTSMVARRMKISMDGFLADHSNGAVSWLVGRGSEGAPRKTRSTMNSRRQTPPIGIGREGGPADKEGKNPEGMCPGTSTSPAPPKNHKGAVNALSQFPL